MRYPFGFPGRAVGHPPAQPVRENAGPCAPGNRTLTELESDKRTAQSQYDLFGCLAFEAFDRIRAADRAIEQLSGVKQR